MCWETADATWHPSTPHHGCLTDPCTRDLMHKCCDCLIFICFLTFTQATPQQAITTVSFEHKRSKLTTTSVLTVNTDQWPQAFQWFMNISKAWHILLSACISIFFTHQSHLPKISSRNLFELEQHRWFNCDPCFILHSNRCCSFLLFIFHLVLIPKAFITLIKALLFVLCWLKQDVKNSSAPGDCFCRGTANSV